MSERSDEDGDTARSYRLDRLAGFSVVGAFVFSLALLVVGEPLFWVPFAVGLGMGLPGFAILADRERDRERGTGPVAAADAENTEAGDDTEDDENAENAEKAE